MSARMLGSQRKGEENDHFRWSKPGNLPEKRSTRAIVPKIAASTHGQCIFPPILALCAIKITKTLIRLNEFWRENKIISKIWKEKFPTDYIKGGMRENGWVSWKDTENRDYSSKSYDAREIEELEITWQNGVVLIWMMAGIENASQRRVVESRGFGFDRGRGWDLRGK